MGGPRRWAPAATRLCSKAAATMRTTAASIFLGEPLRSFATRSLKTAPRRGGRQTCPSEPDATPPGHRQRCQQGSAASSTTSNLTNASDTTRSTSPRNPPARIVRRMLLQPNHEQMPIRHATRSGQSSPRRGPVDRQSDPRPQLKTSRPGSATASYAPRAAHRPAQRQRSR